MTAPAGDPDWDGPWFSASQVSTYEDCKRKWAWAKVERLPTSSGPAAELGSAVHEQLELWLKEGKPLDLTSEAGKIGMEILYLLPAPCTPGMEVERLFGIEIGGHKLQGKKDFEILQRADGVPIVGDHKTTGDFRWAKTADQCECGHTGSAHARGACSVVLAGDGTEELCGCRGFVLRSTDLSQDPQATLYAAEAMYRAAATECEMHWNYSRTKGAKQSLPVLRDGQRPRLTREQITPRLDRTVQSCDEMTAILESGVRALDLPPNPDTCEKFGGCEFRGLCNLTQQERMHAIMTQAQTSNDFLSMMKSRNQINPPPVAAPPPPAPVAQMAPAAPPPQPVWEAQNNGWRCPDGSFIPHGAPPQVQAAPPAQPQYAPPPAPVPVQVAPQYAPPPAPVQAAPPPAPEPAPAPAKRTRRAPAAVPVPAAEAYPPQPAVTPYPVPALPAAAPPGPSPRDALLALAASLEAQAQVLRTLAA